MTTTTLPDEVRDVDIRTLHRDKAYQAREVDVALVAEYAVAMVNGATFPPIIVGIVYGVPQLLGGWHRVAAAMIAERYLLPATVFVTDERTAQLKARSDNLTHGRRADGKEVRSAFISYVKTGQHKKPSGAYKTYREIAADFAVRSAAWLHKRMRSDFPQAASAMGGSEGRGTGGVREKPPATAEQAFAEAIRQAQSVQHGCLGPELRGKMIEAVTGLLEAVKKGGPWTPSDF